MIPRIELGIIFITVATASLRTGDSASLLQVDAQRGKCKFDHSGFDAVLRKFVKGSKWKDGIHTTLFDYEALIASDDALAEFHDYVKSFESFEPSCLSHNQ